MIVETWTIHTIECKGVRYLAVVDEYGEPLVTWPIPDTLPGQTVRLEDVVIEFTTEDSYDAS